MKILTKGLIKQWLPKRKKDSHKGENGTILVIGGSIDYSGAVYLAAKSIAALRTGTDLVTIATVENVAKSINCLSPDLITVKLRGDYLNKSHEKKVNELIKKNEVILIGPGLGRKKESGLLIKKIIKSNKLKVIDADALKMIDVNSINNSILTPHHKEFEILMKNSKMNENNFKNLQKKLRNNVILLKGREDLIISKNRIYKNKTGSPGMSVGGTGDVLAGLCAGFLSQINDLEKSACLAAYINGGIGERLEKQLGYGFIASDFLKEIAKAIKVIWKSS